LLRGRWRRLLRKADLAQKKRGFHMLRKYSRTRPTATEALFGT